VAHLTQYDAPRGSSIDSLNIIATQTFLNVLATTRRAQRLLDQDFIPFEPRNLYQDFVRVGNQPKKYNILPSISVTETCEELAKCEDCSICYEETKLADTVTINCGHKFCGTCIKSTLTNHSNIYAGPSCALCRTQMSSFVVKNPEIYNLVLEHCDI
jgi:hypothetical protein